jgi:hypothetical protein
MQRERLAPWLGFSMSVAVCGIVVLSQFVFRDFGVAFPAFFCFLPMAFFFAALAQAQNHGQIQELQARIQRLEARESTP